LATILEELEVVGLGQNRTSDCRRYGNRAWTTRHASAPGFLALKWAAFWDRGAEDPFSSHDLEDILALTVSRDIVVEECRKAPGNIQESLRKGFGWLTAKPDYDDLVAAHFANAQAFKEVAALLRDRIGQISATSVNK
jgi:hypothetical protein